MVHKCEGCRYKGVHQEMGFCGTPVCTKAVSLEYAAKAYAAKKCPYKIVSTADKLKQAIDDIRLLARMEFACPVCAYYNHGEGKKGECVKCLTGDGFRWRGEKEEEK